MFTFLGICMCRFLCVCFLNWRTQLCYCVRLVCVYGCNKVPNLQLWVDYKGIRTSRERRKQADYTVAVTQPKALLCSPEGSAHRWSTYQTMWRLEESPSSWPFWRMYRKKGFIPSLLAEMWGWTRMCWLQPAPDKITSRKPWRFESLCVRSSPCARLCCAPRGGEQKWAQNLPCRHFKT